MTKSKFNSGIGLVFRCGIAAVLSGLVVSTTWATPDKGSNCNGCHSAQADGMALLNYSYMTNIGAGSRKLFLVSPGQTAVIRLNVTNNWGGNYGLTINNLTGAGVYSAADHLGFTADPTWTSRSSGTYFTEGPIATSPNLWTFNLAVQASTPADIYSVQTQMAGKDIDLTRWSQVENFYVQVASASAPRPTIVAPQRSGNIFSAQVGTVSGFTYYLEYKDTLSSAYWSNASQVAGDGTAKSLSDTGASVPQRFYRIRVQ